MAVAIGPSSTTRWSEVTLPAGPALGWLVPVRPGATIEWASNAWLGSLDGATAPRVLVPSEAAPCSLHQSFEMPAPWVEPATPLPSGPFALPATAADAGAWATGHGLSVSAAEMKRLEDLYTSGWRVAAVELGASTAPRSSPTLRATDDGGAILPLSIGVSGVDTAVTLFVVGAGNASIAGVREIPESVLSWGENGSSYALVRKQLLGGDGWLRESSSTDALFTEVAVAPRPSVALVVVPPVVATYVGAGNDFSIALNGIPTDKAVLTRLVGVLPAGRVAGTPEIVVASGTSLSPVRRAASYDHPCPAGGTVADPPDPPPPPSSPSGIHQPSSGGGGGGAYPPASSSTTVYVPSDGCSGGSTTVVEGDDDDSLASSSSSSDDSCSGDTSSSSDSSDTSGWDSSDSSDACSGDSTSSSSDGWDKSDSNCAAARHSKRRGSSPLSRLVLLGVALLIPLRRLSRQRSGGRS